MNRKEIIWVIKRNNECKRTAIEVMSDFLVITKEKAKKIYEEEFGNK